MKILFIGGDKRSLEMIKELQNNERKVDIIGFNLLELDTLNINDVKIVEYDVIIFPVDGLKDDDTVTCLFNQTNLNLSTIDFRIKDNCIVFSGIKTRRLEELFKNKYVKLMDFNDVSVENSIPTVEGIIAHIIQNTDYTINGATITILGYGRVGKILVDRLIKLGAYIKVGVIEEEDYIQLFSKNIKPFYTNNMKEEIATSDIIINTVPKLLLNKTHLDEIKNDTYIIDISSIPYGVDFDYAKSKNINVVLLQGIPGKIAPKTAGNILAKKIKTIIKEEL